MTKRIDGLVPIGIVKKAFLYALSTDIKWDCPIFISSNRIFCGSYEIEAFF